MMSAMACCAARTALGGALENDQVVFDGVLVVTLVVSSTTGGPPRGGLVFAVDTACSDCMSVAVAPLWHSSK